MPETIKEVEKRAPEGYTDHLEKARKQFPALIKRLSNTINPDEKRRLLDPGEAEFNPSFEYPNLFDMDSEEIQSKKDEIESNLAVVKDIEKQGYTPTIEEGFDRAKAEAGLLNLELIDLSQQIQSTAQLDQHPLERFKEINKTLNGEVDPNLYQGIINSLHELTAKVDAGTLVAKKIADELLDILPASNGTERIVQLPEDVFERYQKLYLTLYGRWLEGILAEDSGPYDPEAIAAAFEKAVESMGFDKLGWTVEIDEDATSIKTSMEKLKFTIPANRQPIEHAELGAKLVHEIGHATRGWNGSSISRAAKYGLPEYLDAEDGLMAYGEQFITGRQTGNTTYVERYLGAGLLTGVIDEQEKDFKSIFAAMWRARVLLDNSEEIVTGTDVDEAKNKSARETSLMNAQRLFRGGNGVTPGVGWTKDQVYYEGMGKLTEFLVKFDSFYGLENFHLLFTAKFDPTNSKHNQYLGMPFKYQS